MKIKVITLTCEKCGHSWTPRGNKINICPRCKSKYWNNKNGGKRRK